MNVSFNFLALLLYPTLPPPKGFNCIPKGLILDLDIVGIFEEVPHWVELRNKLVKTPESLKRKRFGYALDGQKDLS